MQQILSDESLKEFLNGMNIFQDALEGWHVEACEGDALPKVLRMCTGGTDNIMNNLVLNSAGTTDLIFLVNGGSSILHMMP
jgi:hypothetical protein